MPLAATIAAVALLAAADSTPDPCRAAGAPLPARPPSATDGDPVGAYRAAWRRACEARGRAPDLEALLLDAEALTEDVRTAPKLKALAAGVPPDGEWPFPAIRRNADGALAADWSAFAAVADRGTAEDRRFWRAASRVADRDGEPAWLGPESVAGAPCLRAHEVRWLELADDLDAMEHAGTQAYLRHASELRGALAETLGALSRSPRVCTCLPADVAAGLEPLAAQAMERPLPPERRVLARAAAAAIEAIRVGRVKVAALRASPDAPPTGCGAAP